MTQGRARVFYVGLEMNEGSWKQKIIREKYTRLWRSKGSNAIRHGNLLIYQPFHLLHHTEIFYFHYRLFFEFPLFMQVFTDQLLPLLKILQFIFLLIIETAYCKLHYTYWVIRLKKTSSLSNIPHSNCTQYPSRLPCTDGNPPSNWVAGRCPWCTTARLSHDLSTLEVKTFSLFSLFVLNLFISFP